MSEPKLAIIVPVLNEADQIGELSRHLQPFIDRSVEVVLVDGGSEDATLVRAQELGLRVLSSVRGRAQQMNTGALHTDAPNLLFLHADTRLPDNADALVLNAIHSQARCWGRFDVRIEGESWVLPWVSRLMNLRSRWSGIATGDQGLFMSRALFQEVGGFPNQPLMEDIEISRQLKAMTRPICLSERVTTSGRRWDEHGGLNTILLMWHLRWDYWRGVPADQLAERYR